MKEMLEVICNTCGAIQKAHYPEAVELAKKKPLVSHFCGDDACISCNTQREIFVMAQNGQILVDVYESPEDTLPEFAELNCPHCGESSEYQVRGATDSADYLGKGVHQDVTLVCDCHHCGEEFSAEGCTKTEFSYDFHCY